MKKLLGFSIFLVFVLIASLTAEAKVTLPAIFQTTWYCSKTHR